MIQITNPKKLHLQRQKMYKSSFDRRNSFLNKKKNRYKLKYLEQRHCPVCKNKKQRKLFSKEGSDYVECIKCKLVFLNPVFKDKYLYNYYKNYSDIQANAHKEENIFYKSIYNSGLDLIEEKISKGKILDLGCSGGFFLDLAKKRNWDTYGIEINFNEFRIAVKKNHKVWNKELSKINFKERFDVICLWDVFEHIKNPHLILKQIKKKLKKNGLIFLQIPNSDSLAVRILKKKCNMFDPIEHVNLYNPQSLKKLFLLTSFKIKKIKSVIDELAVIKNYLNFEDPYLGDFQKSKNIKFLNSNAIHTNLQGYKLQVIISPKN